MQGKKARDNRTGKIGRVFGIWIPPELMSSNVLEARLLLTTGRQVRHAVCRAVNVLLYVHQNGGALSAAENSILADFLGSSGHRCS